MRISVVDRVKIEPYKDSINSFLISVFGSGASIKLNSDFQCAAIVQVDDEIVGCGLAYAREMSQGTHTFLAGIIGGIAIKESYRGQGMSKSIVAALEGHLLSLGIMYSFLFAYEPNVYRGCGYDDLRSPINYFDSEKNQWNTFVYRGGMVKPHSNHKLATGEIVEFKGSVY
ncbi:hypothetical protein OAG1_17540 [Agarivorans sp. OAG1]|uniref:GNAT family N-acetyltransferase n=1 Tax=Agarivorans sp. OAG1 TaxID=3082387 RepID=UPI002B308BFD|nr:hypothetical protein OAG1_17540 [Agarivorans sp. OAG1]